MEKLVKQCCGIDCAQKDFTVSFSAFDSKQEVNHLSSRTFLNTPAGFKAYVLWAKKLQKPVPLIHVMESTGVYHEKLALYLVGEGFEVSVVVPKRAKDFSKTLKIKAITDQVSARCLAAMGLEKKLDLWTPPSPQYIELKQLTREKEQLQDQITMLKNQIHAEKASAWVNPSSLGRMAEHLKLLTKQRTQILKEIEQKIKNDPELKRRVDKLTTLPGVGVLTAASVIGETNGFSQVRNKRQLVSYAGLDVISQTSGTSVKTKGRISKRGNKHIRKALFMPALTAIRMEGPNKDLFVRLVSKSSIKMKGVVAVQRKLLILLYTLWKHDTVYDPDYKVKKEGSSRLPRELDLVRS